MQRSPSPARSIGSRTCAGRSPLGRSSARPRASSSSRERITADQAFGVLRHASQHLNIKLRDVAQYVVDTGEIPRLTPSGARG